MAEPQGNREHKDRLFLKVFEDKEALLSLYNAVNGSDYENPEELEITTLDNVLYMRMKNDLSFLIDGSLNFYEHQSTFNPNMPLRGCFYMAKVYQEYVERRQLDIYSSTRLTLPTPRFIVFYNGTDRMKHTPELTLKLSDSFEKQEEEPALECKARVININYGFNTEIMEKCPKLYEYSFLISKIREGTAQGKKLEAAIGAAIDICIEEGILTDLLTSYRMEVIGMLLTEYDEERHLKNTYEEGVKKGQKKGESIGEFRQLYKLIQKNFLTLHDAASANSMTEEQLVATFKKYGITK